MLKEIYMPTLEELMTIGSYKNANLYKYMLVKAIEKMISTHGICISNIDDLLDDKKEIVDSVSYVFPRLLGLFKEILPDTNLCARILDKDIDNKIFTLDNLAKFDETVLDNYVIILKVLDILSSNIAKNPEYRFIYKQNKLLDDIFNVEYKRFLDYSDKYINELIEIDPIYAIKLPNRTRVLDNIRLAVAIDKYADRYGIPYLTGREYINKDIIDKPDEKTKKLIKYLYK